MPDPTVDVSQLLKKTLRPIYIAVPIVVIAMLASFINLYLYDQAIKSGDASLLRARTAVHTMVAAEQQKGGDEDTQRDVNAASSGIDTALDRMSRGLHSQTAGRVAAEAITLFALIYLLYALYAARGIEPALRQSFDQAVAGRDSQIDVLKKNRALLVTTMNSIGDALVATDSTSRITFMNPIAEKMTGWQESDAVGKELSRVVIATSEKTGDKLDLPVAQVLKNNIEKEIPANILVANREGVTTPIAGHAVPVWDDAAKVTGVAVVFRDISEKRGAREAIRTSEAHKEAIIESALECVIMMDSTGKVIEFNAAAEQTFGYQRSEALGRPVADLIVPPALRDRHTAGFKRYLQTGQATILGKRVEMTGMRKGGAEIPIELAITQVPRQEPPVFATFIRDISERKAAEAALVAAKDAAVAESQDKSQFLNNMSDELRTPLNAVIGYSEMLTEEINERRPADMVPDLKKINDAGRHLLMLVTDVLDLSRIEAGKMEVYTDTFEVLDLIEDVTNAARPFAERNQNRFKVTCGDNLGSMLSDRMKIRQSILYLVNNASKFAHERDLELRVSRTGNTLQFKMADLSPGIADDTTDQLADAFATSNSTSTIRFGGHGLGLVIARHLCEMLGGTLKGERQVGHSPVYTITLPDKAPAKK